jgi:hypothetical protein
MTGPDERSRLPLPEHQSHARWCALAFALALCAGCGPVVSNNAPIRQPESSVARTVEWSQRLHLGSLQQIESALTAPLPDAFELGGGAAPAHAIRSCADLVKLDFTGDVGFRGTNQDWQLLMSEAVRCGALKILRGSRPPRATLLGDAGVSPNMLEWLPAQMALQLSNEASEEARAAADRCVSWKNHEHELQATAQNGDELSLRGNDWEGTVTYYARGDFDGDSYEDLMLRRDGHVTDGSFGISSLFILTRKPGDACVRVIKQLN